MQAPPLAGPPAELCPPWCTQSTPHGIHQSASVILPMLPSTAKWTVNLGMIDGCPPHVTVVYLGVQPDADGCWQLSLIDAPLWSKFAARLGGPAVAAAIKTVADRAGQLVTVP